MARSQSSRKDGGVSPQLPRPSTALPAAVAHADFRYNNGPVVRTPQVYTTFWGPNWSDATHTTRTARLNQFIQDLLVSPYMNILSQYGAGAGASAAGALISTSFVNSINNQIDKAAIATTIQGLIDAGNIPEPPTTNNNIVLIIYLDESIGVDEPGLRMCESTSDNAFGFHSDFVTRAGHEFYYAVIPGLDDNCIRNSCPGGDGSCSLKLTQTQEQRLTQVTSHEFAEMITDPKFTQGWFGTSSDENGDICNGESATITVGPNTWTVQRQYSKTDDENSNGTNFCVVSAPNPIALRADGPPPVVVTGLPEMLLYDRAAGQADVVGFDNNGAMNLDHTNGGWRTSWDLAVVGNFVGNGRSQVLLYDRAAGQADVVGFDNSGAMNLDHTNGGWRKSWDLAVVGNFVGNGRSQVLLYDRAAGQADLVGFDNSGAMNLDHTNGGWRTTWGTLEYIGDRFDLVASVGHFPARWQNSRISEIRLR